MFKCGNHWPNALGRDGQGGGVGVSIFLRCLPHRCVLDLAGKLLGLEKQHLALLMAFVLCCVVFWGSC